MKILSALRLDGSRDLESVHENPVMQVFRPFVYLNRQKTLI